jgi:hypothetical protein
VRRIEAQISRKVNGRRVGDDAERAANAADPSTWSGPRRIWGRGDKYKYKAPEHERLLHLQGIVKWVDTGVMND